MGNKAKALLIIVNAIIISIIVYFGITTSERIETSISYDGNTWNESKSEDIVKSLNLSRNEEKYHGYYYYKDSLAVMANDVGNLNEDNCVEIDGYKYSSVYITTNDSEKGLEFEINGEKINKEEDVQILSKYDENANLEYSNTTSIRIDKGKKVWLYFNNGVLVRVDYFYE